jgi:hypothetical protein
VVVVGSGGGWEFQKLAVLPRFPRRQVGPLPRCSKSFRGNSYAGATSVSLPINLWLPPARE